MRLTAGSHRVYKTPWQGNRRITIQNDKGKVKSYNAVDCVDQIINDFEKGNREAAKKRGERECPLSIHDRKRQYRISSLMSVCT